MLSAHGKKGVQDSNLVELLPQRKSTTAELSSRFSSENSNKKLEIVEHKTATNTDEVFENKKLNISLDSCQPIAEEDTTPRQADSGQGTLKQMPDHPYLLESKQGPVQSFQEYKNEVNTHLNQLLGATINDELPLANDTDQDKEDVFVNSTSHPLERPVSQDSQFSSSNQLRRRIIHKPDHVAITILPGQIELPASFDQLKKFKDEQDEKSVLKKIQHKFLGLFAIYPTESFADMFRNGLLWTAQTSLSLYGASNVYEGALKKLEARAGSQNQAVEGIIESTAVLFAIVAFFLTQKGIGEGFKNWKLFKSTIEKIIEAIKKLINTIDNLIKNFLNLDERLNTAIMHLRKLEAMVENQHQQLKIAGAVFKQSNELGSGFIDDDNLRDFNRFWNKNNAKPLSREDLAERGMSQFVRQRTTSFSGSFERDEELDAYLFSTSSSSSRSAMNVTRKK